MIRRAVLADALAIARAHVDSWRETYQGMIPDDFLASLSYEQREQMWRRGLENPDWQGRMFVAEAEGQVVGFVAGGQPQNSQPDFDCELWAIYLLKAHQGKGLGRLLFHHFVNEMLAQHKQAMTLWVLAENPTCQFYEHLGGVKVGETEIEIGGKKLLEFAYGWRNLKEVFS